MAQYFLIIWKVLQIDSPTYGNTNSLINSNSTACQLQRASLRGATKSCLKKTRFFLDTLSYLQKWTLAMTRPSSCFLVFSLTSSQPCDAPLRILQHSVVVQRKTHRRLKCDTPAFWCAISACHQEGWLVVVILLFNTPVLLYILNRPNTVSF